MRIREYAARDFRALQEIYQQRGFAYELPDLANPLVLSKLVIENDAQKPIAASLVRLTGEVYLLADGQVGTPQERWRWLLALHAAAEEDALRRGLEDVYCWVPPEIDRSFGRRLLKLGWGKNLWPNYGRKLSNGDHT